jgi:hypothetical protein
MMFRHPRPLAGITVARTADAALGLRLARFGILELYPRTHRRVPHTPDFL